jgi:DHA2 family multidrug resistance protein
VLVGAGLLVSGFSFWQLSHLTLDVGFWDIFWPQLWQGVGFALVFVALTTAALATVPRHQMTQAVGLHNVFRQVMGSVGIASAASLLTSTTARDRALLSEHVTIYNPAVRTFVGGATGGLIQRGSDLMTAQAQALRFLDIQLLRQAAVLAYNHVFSLMTVLFLAALPLVLLLKESPPDPDAKHEMHVSE